MTEDPEYYLLTEYFNGVIAFALHKEYQISPVIVLDTAVVRAILKTEIGYRSSCYGMGAGPASNSFTKEEHHGNRKRNKREGLF